MSGRIITAALFFGILLLVIAFVFPTLSTAPDATETQNINMTSLGEEVDLDLDNPNYETLTNDLIVGVFVFPEDEVIGVIAADRSVGEESVDSLLIEEGDTTTLTVEGRDITANFIEITSNETALVEWTYPVTYGASDGAQAIMNEFGLLLALIAFILVIGCLMAVMKG